jgi:hypothetical protein
VPSKPEVSPLHKQLDSFGRRGRRLTAARLQRYPGVLVALFGQEALADADAEQILAERVERAILAIIAGINDERDRRIAEAVFCAKPEFYGLNVDARQRKIKDMGGGDLRERYKTQRARIVSDVADALQRMCGAQKAADRDALLSPEAQRTARQLYRYAQQALVPIEAYGFCNRFASFFHDRCWNARFSGADPGRLPHGWLAEYTDDALHGKSLRLAPAGRSVTSDTALWAFTYYHKYRRTLLREPTGRDYLQENLSAQCWRRMQLGVPFQSDEIDRMLSAQAQCEVDDSRTLVENLRSDSQGRSIHEKWLRILTVEEFEPRDSFDRERDDWQNEGDYMDSRLSSDLLALCALLQYVFPRDTLMRRSERSLGEMRHLVREGLLEFGVPVDRDSMGVERTWALAADLARRRPPRYSSSEDEQDEQPAWSDELPERSLWIDL